MWLNEFLIELRKEAGYSQNSFPKKGLASSIQGWRNIENNVAAPHISTLISCGHPLGFKIIVVCKNAAYDLAAKDVSGKKRIWLEDKNVDAGSDELRMMVADLTKEEIILARGLLRAIFTARKAEIPVKKTKEAKRA